MRKIIFTFTLLTCFSILSVAQTQENYSVAKFKLHLPEFRNGGIFLGRTALTLFSDDGKYVAVSAKTADVVIYDTQTGNLVSKVDGRGFWAFSFSPDSKTVIAQSAAETGYTVFDVATGKIIRTVKGFESIALAAKKRRKRFDE